MFWTSFSKASSGSMLGLAETRHMIGFTRFSGVNPPSDASRHLWLTVAVHPQHAPQRPRTTMAAWHAAAEGTGKAPRQSKDTRQEDLKRKLREVRMDKRRSKRQNFRHKDELAGATSLELWQAEVEDVKIGT